MTGQLPADRAAGARSDAQAVRGAPDGERAWLVFRIGTHVMCASALDVVGLIEKPESIVTLPLAPPYLLGTFLFRDRAATAISLRQKLRVQDGEDTVRGPFIAARVRDSIVAFWVDEVRDVLDDPDVSWRPMPEDLDGGLFDGYTMRDDVPILHTRFETLFDAPGGVDAAAQWAAQSAGPVENESQSGRPSSDAVRAPQEHAADAPGGAALTELETLPAAGDAGAAETRTAAEAASGWTPASTGRVPRSPRGLQRIEPARRTSPRRETAPHAPRSTHPRNRSAADESRPRATEPVPRAPEIELAAADATSRGGSPRLLWPAAGLAALALVVATLWTTSSSGPPSTGPAPSPKAPAPVTAAPAPIVAAPAPAKSVSSGDVAMSIEHAAPPGRRTSVKPRAAAPANVTEYEVVRGDTLWAIARRFLGNPYLYPEIVRDSGIRNPNLIHPGDIVRIGLWNAKR